MVLLPSNLLEAPLFVSSYTQGRTIKSGVSQLSLLGEGEGGGVIQYEWPNEAGNPSGLETKCNHEW